MPIGKSSSSIREQLSLKGCNLLCFQTVARFNLSDPFGQAVICSFSAWGHVVKNHPEMVDKEDEAKNAVEKPFAVLLGNTAADRLFRGEVISSGFWKGSFPVVVVTYNMQNVGFLKTAYLTNLEPRGTKVWPKN